MELQRAIPEFRRRAILPVAISYDSVKVLSAFANRHGIEYPLLSDEGSRVIRELGLLNSNLDRDHEHYGGTAKEHQWGVPYPGQFLVGQDGEVIRKEFHASYRERETGLGSLAHLTGDTPDLSGGARVRRDGVTVQAALESDRYRFFQRLMLTVQVEIDPGLHIYGRPVPEGFIPLSVELAPLEGVALGEPEGPLPHPFRMEGWEETFVVYEGTVRFQVPVTIMRREGDLSLDLTVRFQACSDRDCLIPQAVSFSFPLRSAPHAEAPDLE